MAEDIVILFIRDTIKVFLGEENFPKDGFQINFRAQTNHPLQA